MLNEKLDVTLKDLVNVNTRVGELEKIKSDLLNEKSGFLKEKGNAIFLLKEKEVSYSKATIEK